MPHSKEKTLSVIITAHSESILTHRTLASVRRALNTLSMPRNTEIILHADNPTAAMQQFIDAHLSSTLKDIKLFTNHFGDLGASRNFAIEQACGKYIATIDADDIMSEHWLRDAIALLETSREPTIAHSEYTVEFEGADSLIVKHGEIDYDTDTLLSVFANRWNSVIVAPRELLLTNPYTPNSPGYGYEDWNLNCRLIHLKVHNVLIPKTAIFVRRKRSNSEWARQIQSMSVLRANPLLAFNNIQAITNPFRKAPIIAQETISYSTTERAKRLIKRYPATHKIAKYIKRSLKRQDITPRVAGSHVPKWLQDEWKELHSIDRQIFPSQHLMETIPVYDTITDDHKLAGSLYKSLVDQLNFSSYGYVIFAPWLTKGGADKYTIQYANTIAELTESPVLVIATLPVQSPWKDRLSETVDFLDFGSITVNASQEIKQRLMEHIVENADVKALHVINSEFGYDFIRLHENYIKSSGKKVIITSFSQSIDTKSGRVYGYSHTHVPFVYDMADLITSDNQAVIDMWVSEYGFDPKKLRVHHQLVDLSLVKNQKNAFSLKPPLRVLWAGRIAPEKLPEVAISVGKELQDTITIDMYGAKEPSYSGLLDGLPKNMSYKGSYDDFDLLDTPQYDVLLYTSLFDGMPNVILEAAAAKLPIIASGVGGIPEFIENHKSGMTISDVHDVASYTDALTDFITNERGASYAQHAYAKLESLFSQKQYVAQVRDMLKELDVN